VQSDNLVTAEHPHSIAQASVDVKGRLKLPAEFLEYLEALKVTRVFITTFDLRLARIYPMRVWEVNEKLFEDSSDPAAERLALLAKAYGGNAEIDKSGRVLLPAQLREALDLENSRCGWMLSRTDQCGDQAGSRGAHATREGQHVRGFEGAGKLGLK
jgi:DNA-binding transcriptional regulator/RsmH inhibitor MraZ